MAVGKLPISQANPVQKTMFLAQERGKKRDLLQKFLSVCSASQVNISKPLVYGSFESNFSVLDRIDVPGHNYLKLK